MTARYPPTHVVGRRRLRQVPARLTACLVHPDRADQPSAYGAPVDDRLLRTAEPGGYVLKPRAPARSTAGLSAVIDPAISTGSPKERHDGSVNGGLGGAVTTSLADPGNGRANEYATPWFGLVGSGGCRVWGGRTGPAFSPCASVWRPLVVSCCLSRHLLRKLVEGSAGEQWAVASALPVGQPHLQSEGCPTVRLDLSGLDVEPAA